MRAAVSHLSNANLMFCLTRLLFQFQVKSDETVVLVSKSMENHVLVAVKDGHVEIGYMWLV